jgi:hypothetical protein
MFCPSYFGVLSEQSGFKSRHGVGAGGGLLQTGTRKWALGSSPFLSIFCPFYLLSCENSLALSRDMVSVMEEDFSDWDEEMGALLPSFLFVLSSFQVASSCWYVT